MGSPGSRHGERGQHDRQRRRRHAPRHARAPERGAPERRVSSTVVSAGTAIAAACDQLAASHAASSARRCRASRTRRRSARRRRPRRAPRGSGRGRRRARSRREAPPGTCSAERAIAFSTRTMPMIWKSVAWRIAAVATPNASSASTPRSASREVRPKAGHEPGQRRARRATAMPARGSGGIRTRTGRVSAGSRHEQEEEPGQDGGAHGERDRGDDLAGGVGLHQRERRRGRAPAPSRARPRASGAGRRARRARARRASRRARRSSCAHQPGRDAQQRCGRTGREQPRHEQDAHLRGERLERARAPRRGRPARAAGRASCHQTPGACGRKTCAASTSTSQWRAAAAHCR